MIDASLATPATPPAAPQVIRREDYRPPEWLVPQTALSFTLGLSGTRVQSRLSVERNPAAEPAATLRLNGDGLQPLGVWVDGVMVNADDPALRANRLGLLAKLHAAMNQVADLSKLSA